MKLIPRLNHLALLVLLVSLDLHSQLIINLEEPDRIEAESNDQGLFKVYSVLDYPELIGILQNKKEKDAPIFLEGGVKSALERFLGSAQIPDEKEIGIQLQTFWLTNELPYYKGDEMRLEVEMVFFERDKSVASNSWKFMKRYRATHLNSKSESTDVIVQLILKSFNEALADLSSLSSEMVDSPSEVLTNDLNQHFYGDGLDPELLIARAKGKTGVVDKFEDLVQGNIRTDFEVKRKVNVGGDAYKVRVADVPQRYENWGAVIDGNIYKKCPWGYQRLYGESHLTTYVFPEANNGGANAGIAAAGMGYGFIGGAIAGAIIAATSSHNPTDSISTFYHDCVHELDLNTGGLKYVVTNPRKVISHSYSILHSSFSKADSIYLTFQGKTQALSKNQYTKIKILPSKHPEAHKLTIYDGQNEMLVPLSFESFKEEYALIISKKKGIDHDEISGYEMRNKKPDYVNWLGK